MDKRLSGLFDRAVVNPGSGQEKKIVKKWEIRSRIILAAWLAICLLSIFLLYRPWRFLALTVDVTGYALAMFILARSYNRMIVEMVCDKCDPSLALAVMREADRSPLLGLFVNRSVETVAAVLNCMMLEGREDEARQAMKTLELHSKAWEYRRTVLLCMYHFMKKDPMEIGKEYGQLGKYAAAGYQDAKQNFKWMHDMQRLTELEDLYDYTRDAQEKQGYRQELMALLEEKIRFSGNKSQKLQMMFRMAQIEFKEEEYDQAAARLMEIAGEGNTLGVADQAQRMLARLSR